MKHSTNLILFLVIVLCSSCSDYSYSTAMEVGFDNLNDSIRVATSKGETWTQDPGTITKHLFPTEAHAEGNRNYSIKVECPGKDSCQATVIDEGPIDDEVYGKRWKATFKKNDDFWQLTSLTRSLKQRY